jgi:anti-sigma B factor antagonist
VGILIKITERKVDNINIISLVGKIDAMSTGEVEKKLNDLIDSGNKYLVVNFSDTDYINSSGLRIMLSSLKKLRKAQGDLKMACAKPMVKQVFSMAGFTALFEFYDLEQDAVARFAAN